MSAFPCDEAFQNTQNKFFLLEYQCVTTKIADFDFLLSYLCSAKPEIRQPLGFVYKSLDEAKNLGERYLTDERPTPLSPPRGEDMIKKTHPPMGGHGEGS
jgi:hypothetical protein